MSRLIAVILLLALSLQASWALAAAYCQHETGGVAKHFGHHSHERCASSDSSEEDGKAKNVKHPDCQGCQSAGASILLPKESPSLTLDVGTSPVDDQALLPSAVFLSGPEKPNWLSAA